MKRWKIGLVILLTLLVAAAGAVLPLCYRPEPETEASHIPLRISHCAAAPERKPLSLTEKMKLLSYGGQRIEVGKEGMEHSEEEILETVKKELKRYTDRGLLPDGFSVTEHATWPVMIFAAGTGEEFDFFWEIQMALTDGSKKMRIYAIVDDTSQKLMLISLQCTGGNVLVDAWFDEVCRFAETFFEGLGIENVRRYGEEAELEGIRYSFPVEDGTEVMVEFYGGYDVSSDYLNVYIEDAVNEEIVGTD